MNEGFLERHSGRRGEGGRPRGPRPSGARARTSAIAGEKSSQKASRRPRRRCMTSAGGRRTHVRIWFVAQLMRRRRTSTPGRLERPLGYVAPRAEHWGHGADDAMAGPLLAQILAQISAGRLPTAALATLKSCEVLMLPKKRQGTRRRRTRQENLQARVCQSMS